MDALYLWLKVFHILAIAVWIGGALALMVLNARLAREGDNAALAQMGRQSQFFGQNVIGPAMIIALLAGIAMAFRLELPFTSLWIFWGLAGWILFIVLGVVATGRAGGEIARLAQANPANPRIASLRGQLAALSWINLLILASVVFAMVFKPTL